MGHPRATCNHADENFGSRRKHLEFVVEHGGGHAFRSEDGSHHAGNAVREALRNHLRHPATVAVTHNEERLFVGECVRSQHDSSRHAIHVEIAMAQSRPSAAPKTGQVDGDHFRHGG